MCKTLAAVADGSYMKAQYAAAEPQFMRALMNKPRLEDIPLE
jgi:hypothetical protein